MVTFKGKNQGIQGDVALTRVNELPAGCVEAKPKDGFHVVAHSETGHNHAVLERHGKLFESDNPLVAYLVVDNEAKLEHHRPFKTHGTVLFDKGIYRINRQREYTPEGLRRVVD